MTSTWQPILAQPDASRAMAAIDAVAGALAGWPAFPEDDPFGSSLATGEAGLAVFFSYLDAARPGEGYADLGDARLERAIDQLASSLQRTGLYEGFVSIAWAVEHLRDRRDPEDPNEEIDQILFKLLAAPPWHVGYDLTSGLAGIGAYALERWPGDLAAACLGRMCERLEEIAVPQETGLAWLTPAWRLPSWQKEIFPEGMFDLGVAHGLPGVLPVLAQALALGAAPESARALLHGAVAYLLSRKLPAEESSSVFPSSWGPGVAPRVARTAWCYGDPGIAATLWITARAAGEPAWEAEALSLARTAARRPPEVCGVRDAGLCHGAAGLGHLFNRLYQATGEPELLAAARAWLARALDLWEPGKGVGGFVAWGADAADEPGWRDDPTLLTGAAGVALALLAAVSSVEPAWDRFLLLSPIPGSPGGTSRS